MAQIFRKKINYSGASEEDLKYMIHVIKPPYWIVLIGALLITGGAGLWLLLGSSTSTVTITGIYHPGTAGDYGEIICFPTITTGKQLDAGMEAMVSVTYYSQSKYGHLNGQVSYTEDYVASSDEMSLLLENAALANMFYQNSPAMCVIVKLNEDPDTVSGYEWSNPKGEDLEIKDGTLVSVQVVTSVTKPVSFEN